MCVIQYCQNSEIMHVMMGRKRGTCIPAKKRELVCGQKSLEERPSEAL
jgi:hypothetical protein